MVRGAFDTLGIKVTKDKKAIKKAYSALVKQYHPEEHPEEWSRIHDAFQEAMEYAQGTVMRGSGFSGKQEETELESFGKAVCTPKHLAFFPAPMITAYFKGHN